MKSMVVLFTLASVACGSYLPLAQPPHHAALVLDPHGHPLDTAEVINARAIHLQAKALEGYYAPLTHSVVAPLAHSVIAPVARSVVAPAVVAAPAAVSHQSRVDIQSSPAVVSHAVASPVLAHSAYSPLLAQGLAGHGHLLKKRSLDYIAYAAPVIASSAVSHQSRVDIIEKPSIVSHSVIAPVVSTVASPNYALGHSAVAAPLSAHSLLSASVWGSSLNGHLLKKRSLAHIAYAAPLIVPSAISHQSRVDVIQKPAVVSHSVVAPVLTHAAPLAVAQVAPVSYSAPLAPSAVWSASAAHLSQAGLLHASHW
ncbi:uncharacterized protein LOC128672897 [Plodia interpunctella]|uniref:uncharacterized protein LOC128672897 n=1 Tax=Plodia interpunctella TaxID=58824 RepID=UPI00236802D4|nr:uncharacterized protein LOC128672897 [Plodia interpunctella]